MDISEWGIVLAIVGLAASLFFGLRSSGKNVSQNQTVGKNSTAIQSGEDTNVGNQDD